MNLVGWVMSLYFLSEESGYSHLYTKALKGKAKKLTTGTFEVSNVTLTSDHKRFIFKANKKHPGIYEIYQLDIHSKQMKALTDLGGMNDYALSPDETKLLIQHSTMAKPPELYIQNMTSNVDAVQITHTVSTAFFVNALGNSIGCSYSFFISR